MASNITIRSATPSDIQAIVTIHDAALSPFRRFYTALYNFTPESMLPLLTKYALGQSKTVFRVAVDSSTEQVVGFIRYEIRDPSSTEPEPVRPDWVPTIKTKEHFSELWEGYNGEREAKQDALYEELHKNQKHAYIKHLMVSPDQQRRGIGTMLFQDILVTLDAQGLPIFLDSSTAGNGLYLRLGFEEVISWKTDNGYMSKEMQRIEKELGIQGDEGLAEAFADSKEHEGFMVRWPPAKDDKSS